MTAGKHDAYFRLSISGAMDYSKNAGAGVAYMPHRQRAVIRAPAASWSNTICRFVIVLQERPMPQHTITTFNGCHDDTDAAAS
jgi:hypothetical protein